LLKPGASAVFCHAKRNIEKGEQLTISYIDDPLGERGTVEQGEAEGEESAFRKVREHKRAVLEKWCGLGCGCDVCEAENVRQGEGEVEEELDMGMD